LYIVVLFGTGTLREEYVTMLVGILFSTCIIQNHAMLQWALQNKNKCCIETSKPISYVVWEWAS